MRLLKNKCKSYGALLYVEAIIRFALWLPHKSILRVILWRPSVALFFSNMRLEPLLEAFQRSEVEGGQKIICQKP